MIVDSMTHAEVYKELERDRYDVSRWWDHQIMAQRRRALKCTRWPLTLWFEHISPRRNRYVFCTRIFDKRMKAVLTGVAVLRRVADGTAVYTTWVTRQRLISPMVLTPHMFRQYAHRANVRKSGLELIKHYFSHNALGADTDNQNVVGRSVRYNGEMHLSCCVAEGVLLGQQQGNIYVVRTFITYEMCSGLQQRVFGEKRKEIKTERELYEAAKMYYRLNPTEG